MKGFISILLVFLFSVSYTNSQEFTYKKCVMDGISVKLNGEVLISDTLLRIVTNGQRSDFPIEVILKKDDFIQMKLKSVNTTDTQIRFTFQPNLLDNKKEKYSLNIEIKDNFTNKLTTMIYFLIPKE